MSDAPPAIKIKVCGVTRVQDALACARLGVDWIGLNFYPGSPRCLSLETAGAIVRALPDSCEPVALFVDAPADEIRETVRDLGISIVQLHGAEPPEVVGLLSGLRVVRAIRVSHDHEFRYLCEHIDTSEQLDEIPFAWLVDARDASGRDRAGTPIAETMIDRVASLRGRMGRLILAGGLTPGNVAAAARRLEPWMVDVAGGVESSPGRKDAALVEQFVAAARGTR